MTDMSTDIKLVNTHMMNELAELNKVNKRERLGDQASHNFDQFENKKNEVNKELIKL